MLGRVAYGIAIRNRNTANLCVVEWTVESNHRDVCRQKAFRRINAVIARSNNQTIDLAANEAFKLHSFDVFAALRVVMMTACPLSRATSCTECIADALNGSARFGTTIPIAAERFPFNPRACSSGL
jgi:hypothetical protein